MKENKALFLDRDGTLNIEKNYLSNPDELVLFPDVKNTLTQAKKLGYLIIVITNQSGIARGYFDINTVKAIHHRLNELVNGLIDDFFICPHHPDFTGECNCRKPKTGLITEAKKKYNISLDKSVMVGDKCSDYLCGKNAGLKHSLLVLTGYGQKEKLKCNAQTIESLSEALAFLKDD